MKRIKATTHFLSTLILMATFIIVTSCVADQSVAKRRGIVKDFSIDHSTGCDSSFLNYVSPYDTCTTSCSAATATTPGFHLASTDELAEVKKELVAAGNTSVLSTVNGSANICVPDVIKEVRPTNAIDIKSDFCSCLNGKPDIVGNCTTFCANKTVSDQPILYVNTTMGPEIALNTKIGNLYKWCTVQLATDDTGPQCALTATDGTNTLTLPVNLTAGSNSFNVNILSLTKNRNWLLNLVENKAGSNAQSKVFQIRREDLPADTGAVGALAVSPISQYTCLTYGRKTDSAGNILRTSFIRLYYYFIGADTPAPIASTSLTDPSQVVCHDEQAHPGADSALYPRLELITGFLSLWSRADARFIVKNDVLGIHKILQDRLANEYNSPGSSINIFQLMSYPNRPTTSTTATTTPPALGYYMVPFLNETTNKHYCPTSTDFNGNQPLLNILGEYIDDTEGLYISEKEAETLADGSTASTYYGIMFVRETLLKNYGFHIENGLKIKASSASMHAGKTTYFYWPTSLTADPLIAGTRKLYTVRTFDTLSGQSPTGQTTTGYTSDKRIGCIPKTN